MQRHKTNSQREKPVNQAQAVSNNHHVKAVQDNSADIKKKFDLSFTFQTIILLIAIIGVIYGTYIFMQGFHNIDTSHNYSIMVIAVSDASKEVCDGKQINFLPPDEATDTGTDFQSSTITEYYISGVNQIHSGFFIVILCCLLIGLILGMRIKHGK